MKLGPCLVNTDSCTIERDGEKSKVTPRCMDVLLYLAEHSDRIVSSDELLDTFWSPLASDHAVHKIIAELRSALGDSVRAQRFIKTIPKRGYKLLVVPGAMEEEAQPGILQTTIAGLVLRLRYADYRTLSVGLLIIVSMLTLSVFSSRLERSPRARETLLLAQYPFQLQAVENDTVSLFAQGLYSNLITRLTEVESLQVIAVDSHGMDEGQPAVASVPLADGSDYQVRGAIVQADESTSLYLNLVRSSSGVVEFSRRLNVKPSALPEDLDPLTDELVKLITSQLLPLGVNGTDAVRSRF